jgi:Na+-driven multidrug efflux pump
LTTGYLPFAGYNFGAKKYKRLISGFKATSLFATGLACTFALIFHFFGEQLIRFFINDTPTVEAGNMLLHALVYAMPFVGIQLTLMVTFQALGQSVNAMVITLGRQFLFYIPLLYTLPKYFGVQGFVFAQPIADILTTIIAVILSVSLFKQARVMIRQEQAEAFTA